ncbi:hypothetical protein R6Q57_013985 [Mikania cordata]
MTSSPYSLSKSNLNHSLILCVHICKWFKRLVMNMMHIDLGPAVVAVIMFILLSPGLLFQMPARTRVIEFGNMYTSAISILIHAELIRESI